jgi:phosphate acetyltransferase
MFGGLAAGVALGAKVPVVLPGRGEAMEVRMASCVLASLVAQVPRAAAALAGEKPEAGTAPDIVPVPA